MIVIAAHAVITWASGLFDAQNNLNGRLLGFCGEPGQLRWPVCEMPRKAPVIRKRGRAPLQNIPATKAFVKSPGRHFGCHLLPGCVLEVFLRVAVVLLHIAFGLLDQPLGLLLFAAH